MLILRRGGSAPLAGALWAPLEPTVFCWGAQTPPTRPPTKPFTEPSGRIVRVNLNEKHALAFNDELGVIKVNL